MRGEIISHLAVTFVYFLLVTLLRWQFNLDLVWLWLGGLTGAFFLDIDHLLYWFWSRPEAVDSQTAKAMVKSSNYRGLVSLLEDSHQTHNRLTFHTALFQVVLLIMAFYVITSAGSVFGTALVMSINLHLLKDEWFDFAWGRRETLADWLFWQIKEVPIKKYLTHYLVGVTAVFLLLTLILI